MVICQFFLQNRCKYGDRCRFEHPRGGGGGGSNNWQGGGSGQRVTFKDSFGTSGQASGSQYKWTAGQQSSQASQGQIIPSRPRPLTFNCLPKEMDIWEKSHMWPFSCFAVDKDLPSLPEFYDVCPEELRLEAYQAMKSGNMLPYTQKVQSLQNEFQGKRRQLQHMTMDLKSKLMAVVDDARKKKPTHRDVSAPGPASVFGGATSASAASHGHYTPLADLTEQEKEAFSAKMFTLGKIPIRPPPREMVN
ncbi:unnamed protein product [Candidula unifasciata]|uniref:Nucleoporin NUP42 n=1 Tax=Candidula unifasciata TaxID=100452 RepID=A0A8S4ABC2_9EUPU|nr:unnamed protein product [Candidula unifasciata]